jgi:hypothetical protein
MAARGSVFIIATTTAEGALIYDRLELAVDWAPRRRPRTACVQGRRP